MFIKNINFNSNKNYRVITGEYRKGYKSFPAKRCLENLNIDD